MAGCSPLPARLLQPSGSRRCYAHFTWEQRCACAGHGLSWLAVCRLSNFSRRVLTQAAPRRPSSTSRNLPIQATVTLSRPLPALVCNAAAHPPARRLPWSFCAGRAFETLQLHKLPARTMHHAPCTHAHTRCLRYSSLRPATAPAPVLLSLSRSPVPRSNARDGRLPCQLAHGTADQY